MAVLKFGGFTIFVDFNLAKSQISVSVLNVFVNW